MREEQDKKINIAITSIVVIGILSTISLIASLSHRAPSTEEISKSLTYDTVAPYIKDYLSHNNLVNTDGTINVPTTSDNNNTPTTVSIEHAIDQLITTGKFDYLKGEKGDKGNTGATGQSGATGPQGQQGEQGIPGAQGPQGPQGTPGANGQDGTNGQDGIDGQNGTNGQDGLITATTSEFTVNGGTLSLKPCAIGQVLIVSSTSTWDCATISNSGIDENTTNVSATLTLSGTSLQATITDSEGNTIGTQSLNLDPTFATNTELQSAITSLNLSQYATAADLNSLTTRVTTLESTTTNHQSRLNAIESAQPTYITSTALTVSLGNYYTKSDTYSKTETNNLLSDKQDELPICANGQVIKYNTTTTSWSCANDNAGAGSTDLTGYATENWVSSQGYLTTSSLAGYLQTANLGTEIAARLSAGTGINLSTTNGVTTITSNATADIFEITSDHTAISTPDPNKIYIDTGSNPHEQWVYENNTWQMIGQVNFDITGYYTKTETDTTIANAITTNNTNLVTTSTLSSTISNYTTTSALTTLLAAKQDKLPTCTDGQIVKYELATNSWICSTDDIGAPIDLSSYATQNWVNTQGFITSSNLSTTLANYATTTALTTATTDMATNTSVATGYISKSALNCTNTQTLIGTGTYGTIACRDIQDITTGNLTANTNLITANTLNTALANYYNKTEIDTKLQNMMTGTGAAYKFEVVTTMPIPTDQDPNTFYILMEP